MIANTGTFTGNSPFPDNYKCYSQWKIDGSINNLYDY